MTIYNEPFLHKLKNASQYTVPGTVGEVFRTGTRAGEMLREVRDVPIVIIYQTVQAERFVERPGVVFFGASGKLKGKPAIFINNLHSMDQILHTIFHEAAHQMRVLRGRPTKYILGDEAGLDEYKAIPFERSAERFAGYMAGVKRNPERRKRQPYLGKVIGGYLYAHRDYIYDAVSAWRPTLLPLLRFGIEKVGSFPYTVVKIGPGQASFIQSPDFDAAREPTVGDSVVVHSDGRMARVKEAGWIYHGKEQFVGPGYTGFDLDAARKWHREWEQRLAGIPRTKIGRKIVWETLVNPVQGGNTAISRKSPPEPLQWLVDRGLIRGRSLDYGSGRSCWFGMDCYDPEWRPTPPTGKYNTITCIYVLNVVDRSTQDDILHDIHRLLAPKGIAYFAVRRDIPVSGAAGRGTFQRYVVLDLPILHENRTRAIYAMV